MATVAGRKKSIASNPGLVIDTPVAHNTLLNKSASQSTSLYQQCSSLRAKLMRIPNFSQYFSLASQAGSARQSTDPVTQTWDVFALGVPLCFLFNLLPEPYKKIPIDTNVAAIDPSNERAKKHAIARFCMAVKEIPSCEQFTVTDLWERHSTDGLVKVVGNVTTLVDLLPEDLFEAVPSSPSLSNAQDSIDALVSTTPSGTTPVNAQESARNNIIREMVETERKYVQDLQVMQKYSTALSQSNTIDQDTIHLLFPGLNQLLNFQRKFLIRLEGSAELPWKEQRWGLHFLENEEEFTVYEPYCANYTNAAEIMIAEEQNLSAHNSLINAKSELPAFLIKPVQRICKYPLLLDSLIKAASPSDYPYYDELVEGSAAAKRITDKINEAQRRAENSQTVKNLEGRVRDWKGHHLSNFGNLLLDDIFTVTKSEVDREYHVFLFEKIVLCCKEAVPSPPSSKRGGKNNSILKKPAAPVPPPPPSGNTSKKKDTPLLLKGRIFLNNVTQAVPSSPRNSTNSSVGSQYSLAVWWRGDDDLEFFTLRCRTDEQLRQWESQINRLISELSNRRASDRNLSHFVSHSTNGSLVNPYTRPAPAPYLHDRASSSMSQNQYTNTLPSHPASSRRRPNPYGEEVPMAATYSGSPSQSQYGLSLEGFEFDLDDEFEDYPPTTSSMPTSGRATPSSARRSQPHALVMTERDSFAAYERIRARTEDTNGHVMTQWRMNDGLMSPPPPPPPALSSLPSGHRPSLSRLSSAANGNVGLPADNRLRVPLHSQSSSTRLRSAYEGENSRSTTPAPSSATPTSAGARMRSASQPNGSVPKTTPPPLPDTSAWADRYQPSNQERKRGSGSSGTSGSVSEDSQHSSSPITPFGSSESSLGGSVLRPSKSQNFDAMNGTHSGSTVKVKVHFNEDIFVVQVPRSMEYHDLLDRIAKKIRLCGPVRDDSPLRVKYRDEDGDLVSLGSTEDVQIAFESNPGSQVVLYVM
ncbi:hypothetical protein CONPUDRAFT_89004 [Coniophora puteana RWD-64-598 SS2]|uniref:RhoGEF-domain-containing protein n=1 Tax=Coniophora puteana (strain RWD-64-598) TaxID=741705 RepID=A0A5M3MV10_CONPW|nr:uncharacterized protein CONPUDRAFT_89004 [Coniophora puteana RWD-64-598 SS2]EIW83008.1 hypothetical protein CONPUDRAFT_89004 [Coniophora puteana RWD-64-598 SS2]